jgi:hypothetical protein
LVYALLERALLYNISFMVMFFWAIMGYASTYLNIYKKEETMQYVMHQRRL